MKPKRILIWCVLIAVMGPSFLSCGNQTGVCTACCGSSGTTYCKDDWTESECKEWHDLGVNGLKWNWHEGQTCAGRGTPATP